MSALTKRSAETRLYTMDLSQLPEIVGGDTIAGITSVTVTTNTPGASPADLTTSALAVATGNTAVQCKISGGMDAAIYCVSFKAVTTAGYTLIGIGYLYIDDR